MRFLPTIFIVLLMSCVCLLGILTLRLAARNRKHQRDLEDLVDALKRSREESAQHKKSLAQRSHLDTVKDEFISTVSHELRTPLTSIRGALGLLSTGLLGAVDAKAHNLLRIASTNTERLIRLINDILDLERMQSGRAPLILRRCSLYDLAREAIDTMNSMAEAAGVHLELISYAPRDAIYFDADPDRIIQVLTNLLSNAVKFSPAASTVSVQIDADADSLILKVIDHGRGIPADKLETVFDRFQQVESSDASRKGGTGLGLAICRSIIQQHGGAIWAQPNHADAQPSHAGTQPSKAGAPPIQSARGTTLWVEFTRSARAGDAQGRPQNPFNETVLLAEPGCPVPTKRGRGQILLVEGDQDLAGVIIAGFEQAGVPIEHACTLQKAVDRCLIGPPELLILDPTLPDGDGFSLVDWLRRQPALRKLPLVVYSGREISEAEMLKLRLGPTHVLIKARVRPSEVEELVLGMVGRLRNSPAAIAVPVA